jgi:hypothetical protein
MEVLLYPVFNLGARWGGWSTPCLGGFTRDSVPIVEGVGWAPGPVWARKISPSPGFDPQTAQPLPSRFTTNRMYAVHKLQPSYLFQQCRHPQGDVSTKEVYNIDTSVSRAQC